MKAMQMPSELAEIVPIQLHPEFVPEQDKMRAIRAQRTAWDTELKKIDAKIYALSTADPRAEIDRLAAAALRGEVIADEDDKSEPILMARAARLRARIEGHRKAEREQSQILKQLRSELSLAPNNAMISAHKTAVANILAALDGLRAAVDHEAGLRASLTEAGYDDRLPSHPLPFSLLPEYGWQVSPWEQRARDYAA